MISLIIGLFTFIYVSIHHCVGPTCRTSYVAIHGFIDSPLPLMPPPVHAPVCFRDVFDFCSVPACVPAYIMIVKARSSPTRNAFVVDLIFSPAQSLLPRVQLPWQHCWMILPIDGGRQCSHFLISKVSVVEGRSVSNLPLFNAFILAPKVKVNQTKSFFL